jgi:predicted acetyltransferase
MDLEFRTINEEEFESYIRAVERGFGGQPTPEEIAVERSVTEFARSIVAVDGDRFVGTAGAFTFELTIPGGRAPMAGVTAVAVSPTHRRRGILTEMMRRQLEDVRDRGEPLAGLFASEGSIYGRFGYGMASPGVHLKVERDRSAFAHPHRPQGQVELVERGEAMNAMPFAYDRTRLEQPGALGRDAAWWEYRFTDLESWRDGASPYFFALHRDRRDVDGYVVYRVKHDWQGVSRSQLQVRELVAATPGAYADLWRFCLDHDLIHEIEAWGRPADEPLLYMVAEPRRLQLRVIDMLYLRLVDVAAALEARRYRTSGRLTFEVRDSFCPWNDGTYTLHGGPDGSSVTRGGDPDLILDSTTLGMAYLGGPRFTSLARAGRVEEVRPGALADADAMFGWDPPPWCGSMF